MTKETKSTVPEKSVQSFLLLTPAIFHAAESARAVHADAYTVWRDIFFNSGGFPLPG
jgi:hypothetical protein